MRYLRACFTGYIGFYSGLGLNTVDIDFTKCKHSIILIIGINGCGKSTLINSLNLFPDPSSSFIIGKDASKLLILTDGTNIYEINIISEAGSDNSRKTTKAFIKKNGVSLNPNGNVTSYKDIIFSEFDLDSNFISLSSLSSNDRGLGDKTPAERKRFVSNIIENLEVYNSIYKNLNKKSLVFKSNLNNLHTKIQNIGQKDVLEQKLSILKNKEASLNDAIVASNNKIVSIQAKNSIDEDEVRKINELNTFITQYNDQLGLLNSKLELAEHKTKVNRNDLESRLEETSNTISVYTNDVNIKTVEWKTLHEKISNINDELDELKTEAIKFEVDTNIEHRYKEATENITKMRSIVSNAPDEEVLEKIISFYNRFIQLLDVFYDGLSESDVLFLVNEYSINNKNILIKNQNSIISNIEIERQNIARIESDLKIKAILNDRPNNCKIDSCPFISDAIKIKYSPDELVNKLDKENSIIQNMSKQVSDIQSKIDMYDNLFSYYMKLSSIRNLVSDNEKLLNIFNKEFINKYNTRISNLDQFNDIRDISNLSDQLNTVKLYKATEIEYRELSADYKIYREKIEILNSNRAKTEKLIKEKTELESKFISLKLEIDSINSTLSELNNLLSMYKEYKIILDDYNSVYTNYSNAKLKLDEYELKSAKALDSLKEIDEYRNIINLRSEELKPIVNDINILAGQLTLLDSYYQEYNTYKNMYDKIEIIKKYSSPTQKGIQTVFMSMYMEDTRVLANKALSKLFNGEYNLLEFNINEKEFRIPFVGPSGLTVDDISSGSSSQIAMMGTVISLALLHQASSKFNIARLDEIDAGLDNRNRFEFIGFLFYAMNALEIEQVFLISHSIEADNTNADIIKLRTYDDFETGIQSGSVIYDYNKYIK